MQKETKGLWLGFLGAVFFAATPVMTRLASGDITAPQLSPWFVAFGRAVLAATLSGVFLLLKRAPWPKGRAQWIALVCASAGNIICFPVFLGLALQYVSASHAAVITALLPLTTAIIAVWVLHVKAGPAFWFFAALGALLVVVFSLFRASTQSSGFAFEPADLLLIAATLTTSVGYVFGARATATLGAEQTICWACLLSLPVTLPGMLFNWPSTPVATSAWAGFFYVGIFSSWTGFFAWYRGLATGGALRVSQLQLLMPFISILIAIPVLHEPFDLLTLGFALAIVLVVLAGKHQARGR